MMSFTEFLLVMIAQMNLYMCVKSADSNSDFKMCDYFYWSLYIIIGIKVILDLLVALVDKGLPWQ